jgi:hypothetical protein
MIGFGVVLHFLCAVTAGTVPLRTTTLTVRVMNTASEPVRNAYVAIVRSDAPWSEPTAERLTDQTTAFEVPAGTYRIVAGAPGFTTYFGDVVQLEEPREATVHLARLGTVAGRVVGTKGAPLGGARIGMFWEFLADHPHRLSALGERHLRGNTLTVADGDGVFELPMSLERSTFVVVEADRKAPRIVNGVSAGSALLENVELPEGGALELHIAGTTRAGRLRLVPAKGEVVATVPLERAVTLWTRTVAPIVEWRSLPAMSFDLLFEPDDGTNDTVALTTVAVARGEERVANIELPEAAAADAAPRQTVRFAVIGDLGRDRLTVKRWTSKGATPAPARLRTVSGGTLVEVSTPCAAGDRFTFESPRLIGAVAASGDCADTTSVALHRRATIRWKMTAPRSERLPRVGKATIADCETHHVVMELPFLIGQDGTTALAAPAMCIGVRAVAGTFAPMEWPRLDLQAGAERDLGAIALTTAATLYVRVYAPDGRPASGVAVSAARVDDLVPLRNVLDVAAVPPIARGVSDAKGWLALNGIPEGRMVLVVRRGGVAYPQLSDVVRVTGDSRRTVDVTLEEPGRVSVAVDRPHDLPTLNVTSFELLPLPDNRWPHALAFRARPAADGTASFDAVPPGRWHVSVLGTLGESTLMALGAAEVTVTPGAFISQSVPIEAVTARGRVTRNGAPVPGVLTLRPVEAAGRVPLTTKLDADGAFTLLTPSAGDYRAIVAEPGKQTTVARALVHVARSDADIDVVLPSGRIEGRVVGPEGNGVAGAHVGAVSRVNDTAAYDVVEATAVSRGDGSFAIDGMRDGAWSLTASTDRLASEPLVVPLADGEVRSGATLRLRPKTTIAGTLLAPDGAPLVGAAVSAILPPPFSDLTAGLVVRTDANGQFTLSPPPGAPDIANVIVRTADRIAMSGRMRLEDGMKITIPASLGALHLTNAAGKWNRETLAFHALIAPDGSYLNPLAGGTIAPEGSRDVLATARIPAQQYRFVVARTPQERALLESGNGAMLPALRTLTVQANSVTEINLGDMSLH